MIQDCLSTISNGIAATGGFAKSAVLGLSHVSLLGTAKAADICGTTVLAAGSAAAGVLAIDSLLWHSDKMPIWANLFGPSLPIAMFIDQWEHPLSNELIVKEIPVAISVEAVASLALAVGSPIVSYTCFKIAHLARHIDRDLFQTAE